MSEKVKRGTGRSLLLTLPIALWGAAHVLALAPSLPEAAPKLAALLTFLFMTGLFFLMMRTTQTHRWRRVFFVALGVLFPVGFIWDLIALRGSMSHPDRAHDRRRHAVLLPRHPDDDRARGAHEDAHLPGLDPADGLEPARGRAHDRPVARGHAGAGQGLVRLRLLLRRHRGGLRRAGEEAAHPERGPALALGAVGGARGRGAALGRDLRGGLLLLALPLQGGHRVPRGALGADRAPGRHLRLRCSSGWCWCSRS